MPYRIPATLRAVAAAACLLAAPATWSANLWFIEDTPLGTMTHEDRQMYKSALDDALTSGAVGETKAWKNPETGNFGSVKVIKDFSRQESACRRVETFAQTKQIKNRARWNFCRQPSGEWKVVSEGAK
jgi:surface antigen